MTDDPERLVAEALRAHAARTPLPAGRNTGQDQEPRDETRPGLGGYGLLSGAGMARPPRPPEPTVREASEDTNRIDLDPGIAVGWILLLALLLGLAAGAVVGLVTLL